MASMYSERSFVTYAIRFNRKYKTDEVLDPCDLDGESVADVLLEYCGRSSKDMVQLGVTDRFATFGDGSGVRDGALVHMESGRAGERGRVVRVTTQRTVAEYDEEDAKLVGSRVFLQVRLGYNYALLFVECANGFAGNIALPVLFRGYLRDRLSTVTMKWDAVMEGKEYDQIAGVEKIEAKRYVQSTDVADGLIYKESTVTQVLNHPRGKLFPPALFGNIMRGKDGIGEIFRISGTLINPGDEDIEVSVQVKTKDGRTKKFRLGGDFSLPVREVLNEAGKPPLSDELFLTRCREKGDSIFDTTGRNWA